MPIELSYSRIYCHYWVNIYSTMAESVVCTRVMLPSMCEETNLEQNVSNSCTINSLLLSTVLGSSNCIRKRVTVVTIVEFISRLRFKDTHLVASCAGFAHFLIRPEVIHFESKQHNRARLIRKYCTAGEKTCDLI